MVFVTAAVVSRPRVRRAHRAGRVVPSADILQYITCHDICQELFFRPSRPGGVLLPDGAGTRCHVLVLLTVWMISHVIVFVNPFSRKIFSPVSCPVLRPASPPVSRPCPASPSPGPLPSPSPPMACFRRFRHRGAFTPRSRFRGHQTGDVIISNSENSENSEIE